VRFDTRLLHEAQPPDRLTGAVNVPVYLSSTFQQQAPNVHRGFVYARSGNPTRSVLEALLARLEGGARGLAFASGLGALTTLLARFAGSARIVSDRDLYGGTFRLFEHYRRQYGLRIDYIDLADPARLASALETPADLVYFETPTNPLMRIIDIRRVARTAHQEGSLVAVDNTFASPALQRPLELGADLVLHSTTQYLGGHSDLVGGALITARKALGERLAWLQNALGAVPGVLDCFLLLRGIHTLGVRMQAHSANGLQVARALSREPRVAAVHYPGLPDHPLHSVARRQMSGYGGMLSFEMRGGEGAVRRFLRRTRLFLLAESLGGVESLVEHPASMTHASIPKPERERHGLSDGLVRLSCGVEDARDLVADLHQALRTV
jgi:cystathionine gamma-lyase